jgi:hypothetical protein
MISDIRFAGPQAELTAFESIYQFGVGGAEQRR